MDGLDPYAEFNRAINEQIKNATNELLKSPDWGAITAICDSVNQNPILCEEVSRVMKKRLVTKGPEVSLLALTLLDALMKNCPTFHRHAAHPEFMETIMKLLDKEKPSGLDKLFNRKLTNDEIRARIDARERTLVMIQAWARSFPRDRFPAFSDTYERLRSQGVIFPVPDKDEAAPVFTPPIRVPREAPPNRTGVEAPFTDPECRIAGDNANLLILTLTESSEKEDLKKNDLIETLIGAVRRSQATISSRLQSGQFGDQVTTEDLFRVNDLLLDAVKYYDGLVSGAMERIKPKPTPTGTDSPKERRSSSSAEEKDPKRKTSAAAPTGDILNIGGPSASTSSPIRSSPKPGKQTSSPGAGGSRPEADSERKVIPTLSPPPVAGKGKPKRSPSQTALDGAVSPKHSSASPTAAPVVGDILDLSSLSSAPPIASPAKKVLSPRSAVSPRRSQISQAPIPVSRQPVNMLDDMFDPLGGPPAASSSFAAAAPAAQPAADEFDPFMDLATRDIKKQ